MSNAIFVPPASFVRFLDTAGAIMPFGKLYFYETQTLIEAAVYDEDGDVLAQPVLADITGAWPNIFLDEGTIYRVRLETALGVEQGDADPIQAVGGDLYPPLDDETGVIYQRWPPGDVRRYGVFPDTGINYEADEPAKMAAIYANSTIAGLTITWPRGLYSTGLNLPGTADNSRMHFNDAVFASIIHITGGASNIVWTGEMSTYDRFGITAEGSANVTVGIVHGLNDRTINLNGDDFRGHHIAACDGIAFTLLHVVDTGACSNAVTGGDNGNLAAVFIENQGLYGCSGRIWVENSQTNGVFVNALDVDLDIQVDGYGNQAIDADPGAALQGLTNAQTELGSGIILHRSTGTARVNLDQSNATPAADVYAFIVPETGVAATASRHAPLLLTGTATVGTGGRGICFGAAENQSSSAAVNVDCDRDFYTTVRSANTLAATYAAVNILPPAAVADNYRRVKFSQIGFGDFVTLQEFKATAIATSALRNYTEVLIDDLKIQNKSGAGRALQFVGNGATGGVLRGRIGNLDIASTSGSSASPLIDIEDCTGLVIDQGSITSANDANTMAIRIYKGADCKVSNVTIYNFGRTDEGAISLDSTFRLNLEKIKQTRASVGGTGIRFENTQTDLIMTGLNIQGNTKDFDNGAAMVFTRPAVVGCYCLTTDLTNANIPTANQLVSNIAP